MPASTLLRVGRDGSATPISRDRGDKQIGLSNFECAGDRQGPFCFACQVRCLNAQCRSAVSLCARLDHCTHVRINAQRSFATLKTTDKAYLTSVAATAAAQRTSSAATCALEGRSAATPDAEHAAERARGRAAGWPAYFVHIQNAGGTTMCRLARLNGVAAPEEAPEESGVFGRNCNPGSADAPRIWKGSAAAQAAYLRAGAYRFVANELALPPELAWGAARYVVVVRHPYALALARFRGSPMYTRSFDDGRFAAFLSRGPGRGGGVSNVMTRQLCGCLDAPQTAECGVGAWSEAKIREFKLLALDHRHVACAKARLDRFSLVLVTELLHAAGPLIARELGWSRLDLLARKVNRQAGCDARQLYANDSVVAAGMAAQYGLDLELYAHARARFCRDLAALG